MSKTSLILVTGVTGFLGSHVVHQLLEAGYRVRGTARSSKVALAQEGYASYGNKYEVVGLDDLINGDYTEILKGVDAVIHIAAPLIGREAGPSEAIDVAVEGNLNLLRQAEKAGITRFAFTSSIVTVFAPTPTGFPSTRVTDEDWNTGTREQALANPSDGFFVYSVEKTLSERAIWDFVAKHPHVDATTVNPPFFFGPFAPGFRASDATLASLSTNAYIYSMLQPDGALVTDFAWSIDVRDVARGLVNALNSPTDVGRKRILMSAEWFSWRDAAELIAAARPELKGRLAAAALNAGPAPPTAIDNTRAKEVLKLEMRPWKETMLEAVDSLIKLEKEWASKGLTVH